MTTNQHFSSHEQRLRREARNLLAAGIDAPSFSARFFGSEGELGKLASTAEERRRLVDSDLYHWLKAEYERLRREGAAEFDKETESRPGRLTVVVPKSLHSALKVEASGEGVSLSELIRLKLTIPYRKMTGLLG